MQMTTLVRKLGPNDARLIRRDSFLIFMLAYVVIIAVVVRFLLPWLSNYLIENNILNSETFITSLDELYPMLIAYMGIFTAGCVLVGTVFGFLLLDERDDNTLKAMLVTPVPLSQYTLYRVGIPAIIAAFAIIFILLVINQALLPLGQLILVALVGSLAAPIVALFYATFAANKVEGFAYAKFVSLAAFLIVAAWFVPEPFQFLFGLFPPFWVSKAYWMALEGNALWWLALLIGAVTRSARSTGWCSVSRQSPTANIVLRQRLDDIRAATG